MITFVLTHGNLSSQCIRNELAKQNKVGIKVGNFSALLEMLAEYWLLPSPTLDWHKSVREAALKIVKEKPSVFWAESIRVDEAATLSQIQASLELLLQGVPLSLKSKSLALEFDEKHTNPRLQGYFNDIVELWRKLEDQRPAEQMLAKHWLEHAEKTPIEPVTIQVQVDLTELPAWQREVVKKLQENNPKTAKDIEFKTHDKPSKQIQFEFFSCQNVIAECEAVASMVQAQVNLGTIAEELAIVVPRQQQDYTFWLRHYLNKAGIHLSNVQGEVSLVDWQRQLIRDLLNYQIQGKPKMQKLSLLVNPLMPWKSYQAHNYVSRLQRTDKLEWVAKEEHSELLNLLLNEETSVNDKQGLLQWIGSISKHLRSPAKLLSTSRMEEQLKQLDDVLANDTIETTLTEHIQAVLKQWDVSPIRQSEGERYRLNAVTLIHSEQPVHKPFKRIWLIGFNQGAYTEPTPNSGAIPFEHWQGLQLNGHKYQYPHSYFTEQNWFAGWQENLGLSEESVIVTNARQTLDGSPLYLSETWLPLAQMLGKKLDAECFITAIENAEHELLRWQETILKEPTQANKVLQLEFNDSILKKNLEFSGSEKPRLESPSSLEKLLVSPFDWLLSRLHIKSQEWEIQKLDPATQGTVAHKVFELYKNRQTEPYSGALFSELFEQAVEEDAPFLNDPQWQIDKTNLHREIEQAFNKFADWITNTDWEITETEQLYQGDFVPLGIKMKGFIDAVLSHKEQVFILDYKKSKSDDRIKRLEKGFDVQTLVYQALYQQQNKGNNRPVITGYYNLNDQQMVTNNAVKQAGTDWKTCVNQDTNQAIAILKERTENLRQGLIPMTHPDMPKEWKKVGIKAYALENNSLVQRFANENATKELGKDK